MALHVLFTDALSIDALASMVAIMVTAWAFAFIANGCIIASALSIHTDAMRAAASLAFEWLFNDNNWPPGEFEIATGMLGRNIFKIEAAKLEYLIVGDCRVGIHFF